MNSQTMDTKSLIINLLRSTGREGIENVINLLESSNFFTVKCHSHHKYTGGMADLAAKHCGLKLSNDEWNAIRYHMRRGSKRPDNTALGRAVYYADKASAATQAVTAAVQEFFCIA